MAPLATALNQQGEVSVGGYVYTVLGGTTNLLADVSAIVERYAPEPTKLVFTSPAQTVAARARSGAVTVTSENANSAPSGVGAATGCALSSRSAPMAFYSGATCTTALATVTIAAGASSTAAFYFRDITVGNFTVTASAAAIAPAAQVENLRPCTAVQTPWQ